MTKTYIDELAEEIARLREENEKLRKWCEEFNALKVAEENAKFKELLKECREAIVYGYMDCEYRAKIALKIDEVLK